MNKTTRQAWQINKYLWMTLGFVLLYLPFVIAQGLLDVPPAAAWTLYAVGLLNTALRSFFAFRRAGFLPRRVTVALNYIDLLLVTLAVVVTRGLDSDLWALYFVVLIFEAMVAGPFEKRLLDFVVVAAYLIATLPHQLHFHPLPFLVYARIVGTRLFFLVMVSALARRISGDEAIRSRELSTLREQMATGDERARIAREVHDGLGHALVSIILRLELCARLIRKAPDEAEAMLKEEIPALRAAWSEGRDFAFHLQPWDAASDQRPLPDTLRPLIGRFAERTGLKADLNVVGDDWDIGPAAAHALTRIVQESLTNVAKHAEASAVMVTLTRQPKGGLICAICDDGKGFDAAATPSGIGLQAMRERIAEWNGSLTLESVPGCTTVTVRLPE